MLYTEFTVKDKTYKLRLTTMGVMNLEDKLGRNPVEIFMDLSNGTLPKVRDIVYILHQSLQPYHNGFSVEKAAELLDSAAEEGKSIYDFITNEVMQVFRNAGLLGNESDESENEEEGKN